MELLVRTLGGDSVLRDVPPSLRVDELKRLLHAEHVDLQLPPSERQRLVYKDEVLEEGTLQDAGVSSGDTLVLLEVPELPTPPPADTTAAPDAAAIRKAITEEASRRGIDPATLEEARSVTGRPGREFRLPVDLADMDGRLMQLLEALEGRLTSGGLASLAGGLGPAAAAVPQQAADEPEADITPPEPSAASVQQLTEMGFAAEVVRKALVLRRNDVNAALEWLLQHAEDADAAAPPTQEQLRQVYGRAARGGAALLGGAGGRGGANHAAMVDQIVSMGFDRTRAAEALQRFGNMELALAWLLQHPEPAAPSAAAAAAGSRDAGAAAAAGAAPTAGAPGAAAADTQQRQQSGAAAAAPGEERATSEGSMEEDGEDEGDEDNDEEDEEDDDEEDEDEEEGEEGWPPGLEGMARLGSSDVEELLAGMMNALRPGQPPFPGLAAELEGADMVGGAAGGDAGPEGLLLRLMDASRLMQGLLNGAMPAAAAPGGAAGGAHAAADQQQQAGSTTGGQQPPDAPRPAPGGGDAQH